MKHLIGKQFELTEVVEDFEKVIGLTLVGNDEVLRLEVDAVDSYGLPRETGTRPILRVSIESLVEPAPGEEVLTDVFGGNFVAAPPTS